MSGEALGQAVAHERCRRRTAWRDAHPAADDGTTQGGHPVFRQLDPGLQNDAWIDLRAPAFEGETFFHGQQYLADSEQPDDRDQEVEPAQQLVPAKGHAQLTGRRILAHGCKCEAKHHGRNCFRGWFSTHADEAAKGEELHGE
jgi:hypothetical protein